MTNAAGTAGYAVIVIVFLPVPVREVGVSARTGQVRFLLLLHGLLQLLQLFEELLLLHLVEEDDLP